MADVVSPLPGLVATVHVKAGDSVAAGDPIITLQSMKMEIPVPADNGGTVSEVLVNEGDEVETDAVLVRMD